MKRQILAFALSLLALCGVLTAVRLRLGIDYEHLARVREHWQIVAALTVAEVWLGVVCWWRAWQVVVAYNGEGQRQSPKAFPQLSRANAFGHFVLGCFAIGYAVCHWLPMFWALLAVEIVACGVMTWSGVVWRRSTPELRGWFGLLIEAEGGDGDRS